MRYLVLSDIHANLEALDACLADARRRGYDRTLLLGDVVGYGGDPNAVIDCVQALDPVALVRGNHDKVACGLEMHDGFNAVAKRAVGWTLDVLTREHREWLAALPQGPIWWMTSSRSAMGRPSTRTRTSSTSSMPCGR